MARRKRQPSVDPIQAEWSWEKQVGKKPLLESWHGCSDVGKPRARHPFHVADGWRAVNLGWKDSAEQEELYSRWELAYTGAKYLAGFAALSISRPAVSA